MKKKYSFKTRFRHDIFLLFGVSIVIPVLLISMFFSIYYGNQSIKYNQRQISSILSSTSKSIEIYLDQLERVSFTPYLYKDILNMMILMKNGYAVSPPDYLDINRYTDNYSITFTKMIHSSNNSISKISFFPISPKNDLVYEINRSSCEVQTKKYLGYTDEMWFKSALENDGDLVYSPIYSVDENNQFADKEMLCATRMIKDFDSKKDIGLLKIDASSNVIQSIIGNVNLTEHSHILLMDENNEIIYSTSQTSDIKQFAGDSVKQKRIRIGSDAYYLSSHKISRTNWKLVYIASRNDIILSNANTFMLVFIISGITLAIAYAIYHTRSANMVSSVNSIIHTIHQLQKGDLDKKCYVKDKNEFAMIADALNKMGNKLSNHIEKEYKAIINQRNAEYIALQSQINPHFLYNILNGFITLNRMGERDLLEKSIIQLTGLFRYTCKNSNLTTVSEEFNFVKQYLELQKLRFEERFEYVVNFDSSTCNVVIPKLLVQPIVENSIIHGMDPSQESILIQICARMVNHADLGVCLEISIVDNGVGFEQTKIEGDSSRVGLVNIRERVSYFNSSAKFNIKSSIGKGTECNILIPQNQIKS